MKMIRGTTLARAGRVFHALSDATRLGIVRRLRNGERCVSDLAELLDASQSRLSFHLRVLKDAGLVADRRAGRRAYYRLTSATLLETQELLGDLEPAARRRARAAGRRQRTGDKAGAARIRPARAADLPGVEQLIRENNLPLDGVRDALHDFLVARSGRSIVGVAGLEVCRDSGLLRSVAVRQEWRSQGLGRSLVTAVIADAERRGIGALYLLTTTAQGYFSALGFGTTERSYVPEDVLATTEFTSACPASATVMFLPLRGS